VPINQRASEVDSLVAKGLYQEAAELAEASELPARAAELWERIWEFGKAAACARAAGDLDRALRNAVEARDDGLTGELIDQLSAAGPDGVRSAVEILADRRRHDRAARLAESIGDRERAIDLYKRGHLDMDAARLLAEVGRDREAGQLLERLLRLGDGGDHTPAAHLLLGQILARRMQHEESVRHLQEAARSSRTRKAARRALVVELAALGLRNAARDVLVEARQDDPSLPAAIDELISIERAKLAPRSKSSTQVVAGRYRLDRLLGAGGAGRVYKARDEVTGKDIALKLWSTELATGNQSYERFVREARVASALRHPNLVECYDFSADMGYIVMELMAGSLAERLEAGDTMGQRSARRMALDLLSGLELAHQRGIIHRDVKPANVFFDARGTAKLGDFGVAHLLDLGQTQTGGLIGTLAYMAPEQITGAPLTIGADLYSVGVTLFQALTGRLPFLGPDYVAQHLGEEPPAIEDVADVAPGWGPIIARLLAKNPSERYGSIEQLRRELYDIDLGDRVNPLMLPATGGDDGEGDDDPSTRSRSIPAVKAPEQRDPAQPRYQFETPLGRTPLSSLSRALDTALDRSVIIERFDLEAMAGELGEAVERRLSQLARGGGPFVQRALSYNRDDKVAVYEAPAGRPLSDLAKAQVGGDPEAEITPRLAARLLKRLARALMPLHERDVGHGAIDATRVVCDEAWNPTLMVSGAPGLDNPSDSPRPEDDAAAVIALVADLLEVKPSPEGLLEGLAPELSHPERAAILASAEVDDAEGLYRFADTAEIAMLKIMRRGWSRA
jgi:serine/threonine-protein kinase